MALRYVRPKNGGRGLLRMEQHMRTTPLFNLGDAILVWVNEGDFRENLTTKELGYEHQ